MATKFASWQVKFANASEVDFISEVSAVAEVANLTSLCLENKTSLQRNFTFATSKNFTTKEKNDERIRTSHKSKIVST